MAVRALIIAIEEYPHVQGGMASKLSGTLDAGLAFRDWLLKKLGKEKRDKDAQIIFCSEPKQPDGIGASRNDIVKSLKQIKIAGKGQTDELFVFFSGHGFAFVERPGSRADVILTSDYADADSSHCCLNLDEMVGWLRDHLGPGKHYYFIDACRNRLDGTQAAVGGFLAYDQDASAEASTFVLQSTVEGAVAAVGKAFPLNLILGLDGQGRSKVWDEGDPTVMVVRYDSLRSFLKAKLAARQPITSQVAGECGESEAVFTTIAPVPDVVCTFQIAGLRPADEVRVTVRRGRSTLPEAPRILTGTQLALQPDRYEISLAIDDATVDPPSVRVDLYEDQTLTFSRLSIVEPQTGGIGPEQLSFDGPLTHAGGDRGYLGARDVESILVPLDLTGEDEFEFDTASTSVPRRSIVERFPDRGGAPDFSESLPQIDDDDLNLWLAILGAGRILGSCIDYSKLSRLPLHDFRDEPADAAPLYVLAGLEEPLTRMELRVDGNAWKVVETTGMPGIYETYRATVPGPQLVSLRLVGDRGPAMTLVNHTLPNYATLLTVTLDDDGEFCVAQYALPLRRLVEHWPSDQRGRFQARSPLNDVRVLALAEREFRRRRGVLKSLSQVLVAGEGLGEQLSGGWCDPIGAALAGYEFLRRGDAGSASLVAENMRRHFPDFPDTATLSTLADKGASHSERLPLFFDGLRARGDQDRDLPLPAARLNFRSLWTAWRSAAEP